MMRSLFVLAAAAALAAPAGAQVPATAAQLRAAGQAGEQADGYLGVVGAATPEIRSRVNSVNIRRRAAYTRLASVRGVAITAVAAAMACELFATSVLPGQYYRLADGVWRRRIGNSPVQRPSYCP